MDSPPKITIYGTESCCYCTAARLILERKGIDYNAISITRDEAAYQEMIEKSGSQRVPQVFIDGKLIGGFDELYTLERSGELDRLLEQV